MWRWFTRTCKRPVNVSQDSSEMPPEPSSQFPPSVAPGRHQQVVSGRHREQVCTVTQESRTPLTSPYSLPSSDGPTGTVTPAHLKPVDVGGRFPTLTGSITSTHMDGPSVALDAGSVLDGLIEVRAASLVGDLHIMEGSRRQDAYAIRANEEKNLLNIAVCDGAGSRSRSNEGAAAISTGVVWHASQSLSDPVEKSVAQLLRVAKSKGVPAGEYATTLIWVQIAVGTPGTPWGVDLVHYGDGDVRLLEHNGQWVPADPHESASESDSDSFALPLATRPGRRSHFLWRPDQVLVLATDGLSVHLDSRTKVGHFLAAAWKDMPDRWDFLSQVAFRAVGAGDDRTAVALWRADGGSRNYSVTEFLP